MARLPLPGQLPSALEVGARGTLSAAAQPMPPHRVDELDHDERYIVQGMQVLAALSEAAPHQRAMRCTQSPLKTTKRNRVGHS